MDILYLNIKALKLFSLWPNGDVTIFQRILTSILFLFVVIISYIENAAAIVYQIIVNFEDDSVLSDCVIASCNFLGYIFIYVCFQMNVKKVQKLIADFKKFLKYCTVEVIDDAEKEIRMFMKMLMMYFFAGIILNDLMPVLDFRNCDKHRLSDYYRAHDPCGLPVRVWWPFDARNTAQYYLLLISNTYSCLNIACVVLVITLTLVGLLIHLNAQMKHLKQKLLKIFSNNSEESTIIDGTDVEKELRLCVQYHNDIISHADEIFRSFGMLLIVHVTLTPFVFGVLGYRIVSMENFTDKLRYIMHLGGWIAMLFLTCYYGQLVLDESSSISDAAYQSEWYNGNPRQGKYISLLIMRSQRPLELKAASITVLSLDTFVSIIKTAYSCFTLLLTISE